MREQSIGHNNQRQLADEYFAVFRTGDNPKILVTLADDVVWVIHGHRTMRGKAEFDGEIANLAFEGRPVLAIEHSYQDGPVVISTGAGRGTSVAGGPFGFVFNDVFTFRSGLISRVESCIVPLH